MASGGSITHWLRQLKEGDSQAAQELWQRYYHRLIGLAHKKLRDAPRRVADEEDVVVCAFDKFFRAVEAGQFPQLDDRNDLWQVLVLMTAQQAVNQLKQQLRKKRGGGKIRGESMFGGIDEGQEDVGIDQMIGDDPTPEFAVAVAEQCGRLFVTLDDENLSRVAQWKLEGHTNKEIAELFGCTERSVERKLKLIRDIWSEMAAIDDE